MPPTPRRRRSRTSTLLILALMLASVSVMPSAFAVHKGDFVLQGDVSAPTPTTDSFDWEDFLEGAGGSTGDVQARKAIPVAAASKGFIAVGAAPDHYRGGADRTTFTQGSKDTLDISDWVCTRSNNVGNKVDIVNAYSTAQRNAAGDLLLYFGVEIREPEGNSNIGMWFLKDSDVDCEAPASGKASTPFGGQHVNGDVLVVSAFTNGGRTANISVYEWMDGALNLKGDFEDVSCDKVTATDDLACAIANEAEVSTSWHSPNKSNVDANLAPNTFFEGGVNISKLLGNDPDDAGFDPADECFTKFLANTRSSQSLTATIFDYTIDELNICGNLTIVKETEDPANADVDFDFELTGPSYPIAEEFELNASVPDTSSKTYSNLFAGDYTIEEVGLPGGWDLVNVVCTSNGGSTIDNIWEAGQTEVTVDLAAEGSVTCTFTNKQRGSILFEKEYSVTPLEGEAAKFSRLVQKDGLPAQDSDIQLYEVKDDAEPGPDRYIYCEDDLVTGTDYWVRETETPTGFVTVDDFEVTAAAGTCADRIAALTDTVVPTITNDPGTLDVTVTKTKEGTDQPLTGFEFSLYDGHNLDLKANPAPVPKETKTTGTIGEATFADLALGEYTICETGQPSAYWTEADPACQKIEITLQKVEDGDAIEVSFENAPLAKVEIDFLDMTGYTRAEIVCLDVNAATGADPVGSLPLTTYGAGTIGAGDGDLTLDHLPLGTYECTIDIVNGAPKTPAPEG